MEFENIRRWVLGIILVGIFFILGMVGIHYTMKVSLYATCYVQRMQSGNWNDSTWYCRTFAKPAWDEKAKDATRAMERARSEYKHLHLKALEAKEKIDNRTTDESIDEVARKVEKMNDKAIGIFRKWKKELKEE